MNIRNESPNARVKPKKLLPLISRKNDRYILGKNKVQDSLDRQFGKSIPVDPFPYYKSSKKTARHKRLGRELSDE